ncbi:unnamed protein product [Medioppia subpectinata]|uniref:Uncharacterized protein n=1 Tax=Medioppia subpectinata TaxID=1979941 RepID=A0A7R9M0J3_9ACAR|nr:unnamed protein product [Medioppia subpectinata]CAG2123376.1 unnamed protein product [Medioppia subpectinata]
MYCPLLISKPQHIRLANELSKRIRRMFWTRFHPKDRLNCCVLFVTGVLTRILIYNNTSDVIRERNLFNA